MVALLLSLTLAQDYEYRAGTGVVDLTTGIKRTPEEFVKFALAAREEGKILQALTALTFVVNRVPDAAVRETAHYERANTYFNAEKEFGTDAYYQAYHEFEGFILRFPQSERVTAAKKMEMESALRLARKGKTVGEGYLHDALKRYPREDFASDFTQQLGMLFYERGDFDLAAAEFTRVLEQYGDSAEVVLALYMLGRTAEKRFDTVDYDVKPLKDAKRFYERFLEEADRMRRFSEKARRWVDGLQSATREQLARVYDRMLQKQLKTAEYYDWKGLPWSAEPYYIAILRDEASYRKILPGFPESRAAKRARIRLAELSKQ